MDEGIHGWRRAYSFLIKKRDDSGLLLDTVAKNGD
jgi:hypothetical protein